MPRATKRDVVRLKPADPFELIRWLARSQGDPRKAVAELVQNSLDAQATNVTITRRRLRGNPALLVWDNGLGVIPEMERRDALHYLATHVGHSRKRNLTPSQRMEQVVAGQYGVGLLGFWAIGRLLELRTRVDGGALMGLDLIEDHAKAQLVSLPTPIGAPATYTEVVVLEVHEAALRLLSGRRLSDYLAAELRGQLLAREVELRVHDGLGRGPGQRDFLVVPRRFMGEKLPLPAKLPVAGHSAATIELHVAAPGADAGVQVYAAGSRVADDLSQLDPFDFSRRPWIGCQLTGFIDFPQFAVPPGTRRGVIPDAAALAFVEAVRGFEPAVLEALERLDQVRDHASNATVWRELRRALKGFDARLPHYDLLAPESGAVSADRANQPDGVRAGALPSADEVTAPEDDFSTEPLPPQGELSLGELSGLRLQPEAITIGAGHQRRVRAVPLTQDGHRYRGQVELSWSIEGQGFALTPLSSSATLRAAADLRPGERGRLNATCRAHSPEKLVDAFAEVEVVAQKELPGSRLGIPEPALISAPGEPWRSRMVGSRWEVNDAHEDYLALRAEPRGHFRYLLSLLAKEIVQRSFGQPGGDLLLERLVEVLAHAERNLKGS